MIVAKLRGSQGTAKRGKPARAQGTRGIEFGPPLHNDARGYNRRSAVRFGLVVAVPNPRGSAVPFSLFLTKLLIRTGLARYLPGVRRLTDGGTDYLRYYSDRVLDAPRRDLKRIASLLGH